MHRIVWSVGGTGVVLACLAVAWLHRPLELPATALPPPPALTHRAPVPPPRPRPAAVAAPAPSPEPLPEPRDEPSPEAFLDAALKTPGVPQPELRDRTRRVAHGTRSRLVLTLRADHPSPQARREAVLAELTASGDSTEPWTRDAREELGAWHERIRQDVRPVRAEATHCYAAGCMTRVTFPDEASFRDAWQRTASLAPDAAGAHLQLPPERLASGEVRVPWLVLRPDRS
jgi:hypothetical protein